MAAIAYITDKNMIDFHRLNGNHTINFWKPSTSKKISNLKQGDLLFFLAKGTERGKQKEKGLMGYGKFQKSYTMSFQAMWSKYEIQNGYATRDGLEEAICKVTKNHRLPNMLNCLQLEEVVFFQYPIYLSEIGMQVSNKLESYLYIDKEDLYNTDKILKIANQFGVDVWSKVFEQEHTHNFKKDAQIQIIHNIYEVIKSNYYSTYEEARLAHFIQDYQKHHTNTQAIRNSKTEFIEIREDRLWICLPCLINTSEIQKKLQYIIGHYMLYSSYIKNSGYEKEIQPFIIFDKEIDEELKRHLHNLQINYQVISTPLE
ncbi:hypothetical protein [Amedibacillus dolichus]|uniref:Uncharacterized protein n=1 Tax=Amedibacillus dolichus DSM 3991 TaxID=428127 RepID=A8RAJ8_9FIRM|nr:hypothetical protein [Amedibacillus dolichus]EDP11653.1 hypothetical protein EUBDOL_00832 [Amedibacillus dolichus DSM 3991]